MNLKKAKMLLCLFLTAFTLNLIWENAQAPLYIGFESFRQHFLSCLIASVMDAVVILAIYLMISMMRKDILWLFNIRSLDIIILFISGLLVSVLLEKWGLTSGAWSYNAKMALIFGIGLAPVLQLSLLSIISVYIVKLGLHRKVPELKLSNQEGKET